MADGLIHRPNGVILDAKTKTTVGGANENQSVETQKRIPSLTQSSAARDGAHSTGTILDTSDKFDVRDSSETEDFKKSVSKARFN